MNLDEDTKNHAVESMRCSLQRAEYTFNLLWTLKLNVNSLFIVKYIYKDPTDKIIMEEMKDMINKFTQRTNIYEFWKSINDAQKQKILDWYNFQKPEVVIAHPLNLLNMNN